MEEEPSLEEVLEHFAERIEALEQQNAQILEAYTSLYVDHEALLGCMRSTGQFSIDMFQRNRRDIIRGLREN